MHENAAGFSISNDKINDLLKYANQKISNEGLDSSYDVDFIFSSSENISELLLQLASNEELFGNDIESPTIVVQDIPINKYQLMGENQDTVKIVYNNVEYIKFKDSMFADALGMSDENSHITVYGHLGLNKWGGKTTVQCIIDDYDLSSGYDFW